MSHVWGHGSGGTDTHLHWMQATTHGPSWTQRWYKYKIMCNWFRLVCLYVADTALGIPQPPTVVPALLPESPRETRPPDFFLLYLYQPTAKKKPMSSKLLLVSTLTLGVHAGAPPVWDSSKLTTEYIPETCSDAKAKYNSAGCCGADPQKPYIPLLSYPCEKVAAAMSVTWNGAVLSQPLTSPFWGAMLGFFPPQLSGYLNRTNAIGFDAFRASSSNVWTWGGGSRNERAGFDSLIEGNPVGGVDPLITSMFSFANADVAGGTFKFWYEHAGVGVPVPSFSMNIVETPPSCKAWLLNMAGDGGLEANLGFYGTVMESLTGFVVAPKDGCALDAGTTTHMGAPVSTQPSLNSSYAVAVMNGIGDHVNIQYSNRIEHSWC